MAKPKFLKALIIKYVEEKMYAEAQDVFKRYPSDTENQAEYMICRYLAHSGSMSVTEKVSGGLELFNQGYKDPQAAGILINALYKAGSKKADEYLDEARHLWPDVFKNKQTASAA